MIHKLNNTKGLLFLLISFCFLLYFIRIKLTHSLFFGFLIWNLFLAYIPYFISSIIVKKLQKSSRLKLISMMILWLLFLPNAPYIITDFIHLHHSKANLVWLDIFILFSFSLTGLLLAIVSMQEVYQTIKNRWSVKTANYLIFIATFLSGFGIYLGRFLRFNSWDILTSPLTVFKKSFCSFNDPKTWFITIAFGSFIWILFLLYNTIKKTNNVF